MVTTTVNNKPQVELIDFTAIDTTYKGVPVPAHISEAVRVVLNMRSMVASTGELMAMNSLRNSGFLVMKSI